MPGTRAWIHLTETSGFILDTLWFGFDTFATYGIDSSLCELESPWPWTQPAGLTQCDSRFLNMPSHAGEPAPIGLGNGVYRDFRTYFTSSQTDTHLIAFAASWPTVFTFHWSPSQVRTICDSAVLVDALTGGTLVRVPLHSGDSVHSTSAPLRYLLLRYGAKQVQVGIEVAETAPRFTQLYPNYPNPFNPSTTILCRLGERGDTRLEVFNLLGQRVAVLVNRFEEAGEKHVAFDGQGLASGTYVIRLRANQLMLSRLMILQK
jgi:hypothetical protein